MSSAGNTFLRLNSTVSQPGSPTSLRGAERLSMMGSAGDGGVTIAMIGTPSVNGAAKGTRSSRCGGVCWRYLSSNPRLRKGLAHAGLVVLLCLYTAAGASMPQCQQCMVDTYFPQKSELVIHGSSSIHPFAAFDGIVSLDASKEINHSQTRKGWAKSL
ncbi:hypothetical protein OUZ56_000843 [Daphnia magna]|uniref:Uncharacterized protein n=1 Tax=Daphnia magna TaxID=35525 RepID=A0ABR0A0X2_9CRUS|nr:hypothetical protein OUZ56_000843 [Daphnia magna]